MIHIDHLTRPARCRRWQFSVRSLFAITLSAAVVLAWWTRPGTVEVYALFTLDNDSPQRDFATSQQEFLDALQGRAILEHLLADPEISRLALVRGISNPDEWLHGRLRASLLDNTRIVYLSLTVADHRADDAKQIIDRFVALTMDELRSRDADTAKQVVSVELIQPAAIRW